MSFLELHGGGLRVDDTGSAARESVENDVHVDGAVASDQCFKLPRPPGAGLYQRQGNYNTAHVARLKFYTNSSLGMSTYV